MYKVLGLFIALFILVGCTGQPAAENVEVLPGPLTCEIDSDCVCGGKVKSNGECFVGNKIWAEHNVDMSQSCPDFCSGIAGNLETKCVSGECKIVPLKSAPSNTQCKEHSDCVAAGCSGAQCMPRDKAEGFFSTCEWKDEYECVKLSTCGCFAGNCRWDQRVEYVKCLQKHQIKEAAEAAAAQKGQVPVI